MYCGHCGKDLENDNVLVCPSCGARVKNDINYCTNCGGLRKNKKKKSCVFCNHLFEDVNRDNTFRKSRKKVNNKIGGLIVCIIFFCFFIFSLLGLYQDITATIGYVNSKNGQYISATEMHLQVPFQIIIALILGVVCVKVFIGWLNEIRKK